MVDTDARTQLSEKENPKLSLLIHTAPVLPSTRGAPDLKSSSAVRSSNSLLFCKRSPVNFISAAFILKTSEAQLMEGGGGVWGGGGAERGGGSQAEIMRWLEET